MRTSIRQATMAVLAGCGVTATTEPTATDPPALAAMATGSAGQALVVPKCPDPLTDCTHSNGSGVYFEEDGDAGINAPALNVDTMMMITAFTSLGSSVTFRGRYADPVVRGLWRWTDGNVESADYGTMYGLRVVKLSEELTIPTWTLDLGTPGPPIQVTGDSLLELKLHVTFNVVGATSNPVRVVLGFDGKEVIRDTDPDGHVFYDHPVLYAYNLRWSPDVGSSPPLIQYCHRGLSTSDGSLEPDQVVFQRDIAVDPVTGTVTSAPGSVTMSCAWGAVAKAYNFGYHYVGPADGSAFDRSFYEAAIHMKRAAYCGDFDHYTVSGVRIGIHDSLQINRYPPDASNLEAQWSPRGATCVNPGKLRYPHPRFSGHCVSGWSPPPCGTPDPRYLEDYIPPAHISSAS